MKKIAITLLTACVGGVFAVGAYKLIESKYAEGLSLEEKQKIYFTNNPVTTVSSAGNLDFTAAAALVTPGVVHIKTEYPAQSTGSEADFFGEIFGGSGKMRMPRTPMASGSGVIIASDGYIATNNHVVENAEKITVVLSDKHSYEAKLIGRDPNTDLALLKISASNLPVVKLGNSDNVQVGEWVLAVGFPFSLNTTVTAGIVSAKGRSIGILGQDRSPYGRRTQPQDEPTAPLSTIESFIQTDAAINRGNSGGALVNSVGELIGINAAIASQSGSYEGYGFAIPINLAKKVLQDFKEFGSVKRGYLGINYPSPSIEDEFFKEKGIDPSSINGAYITEVQSGSAAAGAGLKSGDIIRSINGVTVNSSTEFAERVARHRPGDKLQVGYTSDGRNKIASITLKGEETLNKAIASNNSAAATELSAKLGASFAPLSATQKQRYGITSGVVVSGIKPGGLFESIIPRGTIITSINGKPIFRVADISTALAASRNNMATIRGITPDGGSMTSTFPLTME